MPRRIEDIIAFDRQSARSFDEDGRMRVRGCVLSSAEISPYRGDEIQGWESAGLDPDRIYHLYRRPESLSEAVSSVNGSPLLIEHVMQTAADPQKEFVAGSIYNARYEDPDLIGDLIITDGRGIDMIESGEASDLSCGYLYDLDLIPGEVNGKKYDGSMKNLRFNHVALVMDGRVTRARVSDENTLKRGSEMDPNDEVNKLPETDVHELESETEKRKDVSLSDIADLLRQVLPLLQSLRESESPVSAEDESTEESEQAELGPIEVDEPEGTGARGEKMTAMDSKAVRDYADRAVRLAVQKERERSARVEQARRDVRSVLGDVIGLDSAQDIYREALKLEGVDVAGIPQGMERIAWDTYQHTRSCVSGADRRAAFDEAPDSGFHSEILGNLSKIRLY